MARSLFKRGWFLLDNLRYRCSRFEAGDRPTPTHKAEDFPKALAVERHEFTFGFHGAPDFTTQFGDAVDWGANPTQGAYKTHLGNECLNRHFHFDELSTAYWQTGDERFVRAIARDWIDWVEHNPRPEDSGNQVEWPYADGFLEAYRAAWSAAEALFQMLDEDATFRVERIPQGTHIVRLHVAATSLPQFSERLRERHILLTSPAPGEGVVYLKINPSILRVPAAELAGAFRAAI